MRAKLVSRAHGEFAFGEEATIGRTAGSTVRLEAAVISSEHALIRFDPERSAYVLEDLDSLNGTELDGAPIDRKEVLGRLNVIRFGGSEEFIFQLVSAEAGSQENLEASESPEAETRSARATGKTQVGVEIPAVPEALREPAAKGEAEVEAGAQAGKGDDLGGTRIEKDVVPLPDVLARASAATSSEPAASAAAAASGFELEFDLEDGPERFALRVGDNVVGRSKTADIRLDLPDLSRRHATLIVAEDEVRVRDEGSRNHTFVDGQQIDRETVAPVGAQIIFGRVGSTLLRAKEGGDAEAKRGDG
jgi:pSer/pThr/pTyr-binding forkhead associated (FHA) protein